MKKIFFLFLISFFISSIQAQNEIVPDTTIQKKDTLFYPDIYDRAEVMPKFAGGVEEMLRYLANNIRYPKKARINGLEGKVIVRFVIDVDGKVTEPIILKDGVGGGAAEESLRVIKEMPNWIPGTQKGIPVKVYYLLPVTFTLDKGLFEKSKNK